MDGTEGLVRGQKATDTGSPIKIPVGHGTLGRIMNVTGDPIDERGPIKATKYARGSHHRYQGRRPSRPLRPWWKDWSVRRCRCRKDCLHSGADCKKPTHAAWSELTARQNNIAKAHGGFSVFTGVGERTREGNDLYHEMQETSVIQLDGESKVALVFGQMNEPPGARARVALTGKSNSLWRPSLHSKHRLFFHSMPEPGGLHCIRSLVCFPLHG
jgi:F-type H+-transporting ATPase subunit beta